MSDRSIPEATAADVEVNTFAVRLSAVSAGINPDHPDVARFLEREVEVRAQKDAEIRWLREMIHDPERMRRLHGKA